jgi:hypothetical protein
MSDGHRGGAHGGDFGNGNGDHMSGGYGAAVVAATATSAASSPCPIAIIAPAMPATGAVSSLRWRIAPLCRRTHLRIVREGRDA